MVVWFSGNSNFINYWSSLCCSLLAVRLLLARPFGFGLFGGFSVLRLPLGVFSFTASSVLVVLGIPFCLFDWSVDGFVGVFVDSARLSSSACGFLLLADSLLFVVDVAVLIVMVVLRALVCHVVLVGVTLLWWFV